MKRHKNTMQHPYASWLSWKEEGMPCVPLFWVLLAARGAEGAHKGKTQRRTILPDKMRIGISIEQTGGAALICAVVGRLTVATGSKSGRAGCQMETLGTVPILDDPQIAVALLSRSLLSG